MTQHEALASLPEEPEGGRPEGDATRLEQFLHLHRTLLTAEDDARDLAARLAAAIGTTLVGLETGVGVHEDGAYRVHWCTGVAVETGLGTGGSVYEATVAAALRDGRVRVVRDAARTTVLLPFRAGETVGALHLHVAPHAALRDEDVHLARALAELAGIALANAAHRRRLAEVARARSDALAAMAHDLRAPLNALIGYASLLAEEALGPLTAEQADAASALRRQALELIDLVGATLDVARLECGRLPIRAEDFALSDVFDALGAGTFRRPTAEGRLAWQIAPALPPMRSDRVKVKEIVQNLVDNALKHAGDAPVAVDATLAGGGETARITVRDGGPGIPPDVLPRLFEPFGGGDGRRGTGFGLYIVRRFAEALGGRVAAHTAAGEGTAVIVEIPLISPAR